MKRILCSLLSILFVFGIWFSVPMTASAANNGIIYLGTYEIEEQINPIYKGFIDESNVITNKPDVYYSDGLDDFDASLYSSDKEVSATVIREGMENRLATVTVYYKTNVQLTEETANTLFSELQELAFKETDVATQGDSLRYGYKSSSANIEGVSDGTNYYYKYIISYEYYTTAAQEAELTKKVAEVIASFEFTSNTLDRTKSDIIYRYITSNVTYDNENLNNEAYYLKFTPYAALINKTAVCQGYALLYYRLAEEAGLDSRVITGTSLGENHAWNIVKIGDYYYYLDSTWDAGKSGYAYYLKGKQDFFNHINEERFNEESFTNQYPLSLTYAKDESFTGVDGDFEYIVYNGFTTITKYTGNAENVVVPATVNGYKVYSVLGLTFNDNNTVKTITFSEGIKSISNETMHHCDNLETINIPSTMDWTMPRYNSENLSYSLCGVGPSVCKKVKTINLAANNPYMKLVDGILYSADMEVLIYCPPQYQKSVITVPEGVKEITGSAFEECENITEIKLPSSLLYIGYWAFNNCFNLEKCDLSANIEVIGQYAFHNTKVKTIHIPASMKLFIPGAYGGCLIEKITVAENNETFYMQNDALCSGNTLILCAGNNGKSEYVVPSNIVTISPQAFQNAQFKKITLNSGLKYIDSFAFANARVKDLVIPDGVLEIGNAALQCGGLTTLIIPDSVVEIASNAIEPTNTTTLFYYYSTNSKAYEYFTSKGFKCMPITEFKCGDGHNFERQDYDYYYEMVCSVCGGLEKSVSKKDMYHSKIELVKEQVVAGVEKPQIKSVTYDGVELVEGVDYIVEEPSMDIIGYNLIYIQGIGDYYGRQSTVFELLKGTLDTPVVTTKNTAKGIQVSWGAVENAEKYIVYQRVYNEKLKKYSGWKAVKTTTDLTYTDTTVKLGTIYSYTVKAVSGSVQSKFTATKGLRYNVTPTVKTAMAANGIKVTWSKAANATGYTVYSSSYNSKTKKWSGWTNRGTTKNTSWTDTKAKSGTQYRYTVKAMNNKVASTYNKNGTKLLFLAQPTVKIANNAGGVKLSWNKIAGSAGYTIYRAEYANGKWSSWKNMVTIKNGSTVSWVDKSAVSGTQYRYTVRAVNGSTMSTYKASNSVIYLAQPKVSFANAAGGMKVSWGAVPGATGYKVYSSTYNASTKKWSSWTARGTVTATSWTDTSVKSGTYYKYTVKAVNSSYTSTFMATSGLIRLAQPTVKAASDANGVKVTWNKIAGAKNYVVYRAELKNGEWSAWSNKGTLANTVFAWVDKSTVKGATYRYTVRAINNKAGSSYAASNSVVPTVTTAATITSSNAKTQFTPILAQYYSLTEGRHDAYLANYTNYKSLLSESWYQQNDPYRGTSHLYKFKTVKSETELRNSYKKYISASLVDNMPMGTLVSLNGNFYLAYNNAVGMGTYDVNSIKFKGEANGGYLVSADYYNSGGVYCQTDVFLVKTVNGKLILDSLYDTVYDHDYDYVSPSYSSILGYCK